MNSSIFIITGLPGHGKTTLAATLADAFDLKMGSTSDPIYQLLASRLAGNTGMDLETAERLLRSADKEILRPTLVRYGNQMVVGDPSALVQMLIAKGCRIIDGVRRKQELNEALKYIVEQGFTPAVIWVARRPAPPQVHDNTEVCGLDADHTVINSFRTAVDFCNWIYANSGIITLPRHSDELAPAPQV